MKNLDFNITAQERSILVFFICIAVLGLSINLCFKYSPSTKQFLERVFIESSQYSQKKLNINKASKDDLLQLPGIGPVIADNIIEYRNKNGQFSKLEELKYINGISGKKFEKIKRFLII